ncbi:hypothetical protein GQ54DRAFT_266772 [Martensiomyces pterosporus]|nr:hypothetical protein GQ54DRAFT_266772 [Martensiomyces pterosporus]
MAVISKPVRIVIAGGNYGGLSAAKNLYLRLLATNSDYDGAKLPPPNPSVQITLIDRRDGFVHYLGMTRGISQPEYGARLWAPYSSLPWLQHPSIRVRKGVIKLITPTHVELADTDERVEFDYLVVALGQSRQAPIGVAASTRDEFLKAMARDHDYIKGSQSIVVVGGGAVGTELSADLKSEFPQKDVTLIHSRNLPVPGPFMSEFRQYAADVIRSLGVRTVFEQRVVEELSADETTKETAPVRHSDILPELADSVKRNVTLVTSAGEKIHGDLPIFSPSGIRVKKTLQVNDARYPHIFAVGDVCNHALVKLAGAATSGGRLAANNIAKLIHATAGEDAELEETGEPKAKMKLVLGEKHAVIQGNGHVIPPEIASSKVAPDIKLGKALRNICVDAYPTLK